MSRRSYCINAAVFVPLSALLVACGGGGGGGGGGNVTASSAPVTISAANAEEVAAASYKTTAGLEGGGSGATGFLTGAVTENSPPGDINLVDTLIKKIKDVPELASANGAASLTGVVVSETIACTNSGSISITFDDADNDQQLSTGDTMSFSASNCSEDGMTMNGSVSMNNVSVSGDPLSAPHSMQLSIQANNFTIMEVGESAALNGGMTVSESTSDGILFTHSITGSSIEVTEGGVSASLSNFNIEATEDNNTLAYTLDLNATVSSSELGGSVTIVTDTVFAGIEPNEPTSGQATITGANNSRVTLIAMGADNVRLEIDEDGNGTAETFIDTTWGAL